jgi:molybdate transport system ATP-binding protein
VSGAEIFSVTALTLRVGALATLCVMPLAITSGWCLVRFDFPGKTLARALIGLPMVLPPVAVGLALLWLLGSRGPLGALWQTLGIELAFSAWAAGLAAAVVGFPLAARACEQAFAAVDRRTETVAQTLGVPPFATFLRVSLPLARRGVLYGALLCFTRGVGEFGATAVKPSPSASGHECKRATTTPRWRCVASLSRWGSPPCGLASAGSPGNAEHDMSDAANIVAAKLTLGEFTLDVDLAWEERVVVFFGRSGAGKSSLFELILGLHPAARSRVRIGGEWLADSDCRLHTPVWRRGLGWVPQDASLFEHLDVAANLRFGPRGSDDAVARQRAIEVLELGALLERDVRDLSGGERQRVAIGRALASAPRALLLDEPLASLDVGLRARVLRDLLRVRDEFGLPILAITHDPDEAMVLGERVTVLDAGRVAASGEPRAVLWSRAVLPLAASLGVENVFEGRASLGDPTSFATDAGLQLALPEPLGGATRTCIGIRAEDVLIAVDPPTRISARNVLAARVTHCEDAGADTFVHLAIRPGNEPLVAKLTGRAVRQLELRAGMPVHAIIKAQAIRRLT